LSSFKVAAAISTTAASKASWFTLEGLFIPLTLRTNCNAAAEISAGVTGASGWRRTLMLLHMILSHYELVTVFKEDSVCGFLHEPAHPSGPALALTHGAGGNAKAPFLEILAEALCARGWWVLRCDMAFRQRKPFGPPSPSTAAQDRQSLRDAVTVLRKIAGSGSSVLLGGHSYGGRQSTMLAAEDPALVKALLLCSYPLHPPGKPGQPRTAHFPDLKTPALFVHGTRDAFGSVDEMTEALKLIPAHTELSVIEGAGHDLKRGKFDVENLVVSPLRAFVPA
jgi:uncharacterized protein